MYLSGISFTVLEREVESRLLISGGCQGLYGRKWTLKSPAPKPFVTFLLMPSYLNCTWKQIYAVVL